METVEFVYHSPETAPDAKASFAKSQSGYGFIPTLHQIMAEAPTTYEAYMWLMDQVRKTEFSPLEQQVIFMTANFENRCHYCTAGHSYLMNLMKMPSDYVEALREGTPLPDKRHEELRSFVRDLIDHRGHVGDDRLGQFLAVGYSRRNALETLVVLSAKLLSNFTNALAHTELDEVVKPLAWVHPSER